MQVEVVYNGPVVARICEQDGQWLVTTHNRRLVKVQQVVSENNEVGRDTEDAAGAASLEGMLVGPGFGVRKSAPSQANILDKMLTTNAQWLVIVETGMIVGASRVEKPAPVPKRRRRKAKVEEVLSEAAQSAE